jgi:hypothetical protein
MRVPWNEADHVLTASEEVLKELDARRLAAPPSEIDRAIALAD